MTSQCWENRKPIVPVESLGQGAHITEWLVLAPFPLDGRKDLRREQEMGISDALDIAASIEERFAAPLEGSSHANPALPGGETRWRRFSGEQTIDLKRWYPEFNIAVAYAATYLLAERDTDLLFFADGTTEYLWSTMTLAIDGVQFGKNDTPSAVHIPAGEHLLLSKIVGGSRGRFAWKIDVRAGVMQSLAQGLGAGLARLTGFWRGEAANPRAEIEVVLANRSESPIRVDGLTATIAGNAPGPAAEPVLLHAGAVSRVRVSAPAGPAEAGSEVGFSVRYGSQHASARGVLSEAPPDSVIHVVQGFHCDPVWLSDQHHYNLVSLDNVRQLLDACLADPNYRVFLHEIDYLKPFVDEYPDYRAVLFGLIQSGQVSLGSSYNQPNEGNCSGEAIIRNILYGYGFHRRFLGGDPGVYHAWDVFGHTPQLSQIVAKSDLIGVLWSKPIVGFPPLFRHMALDGTTLPHIRTLYGWGTHSMDRLRESTAGLVKEKASFGIRRHLAVDAGDFSCPTGWMVNNSTEMWDSLPKIVMTGPEAFLRGVADDGSRLRVTSRTESQYHVGTQHSRSEMKLANRLGENALVAAERWATFASLMGAKYPDRALDKAWRQLLFAQHHDALSGTPSDVCYIDLMAGYREALELAADVLRRSTRCIAELTPGPTRGRSVTIFNSLNWARKGLVSIPDQSHGKPIRVCTATGEPITHHVADGTVLFVSPEVPSVGYTAVTIEEVDDASAIAPPQAVTSNVLENEHWRIILDPARGGGIASLFDKTAGRELVETGTGVGNDLLALTDRGVRGGSPWEFWTMGGITRASERSATVTIQRTPVGDTAVIEGELPGACEFTRTLTLRPDSRAIEASVVLRGYRRDDLMFVATFPAAIRGSLPVVEDRFGTIATKRNRFAFDYRTGGNHKYSDCVVTPVYNWIASGWSARIQSGPSHMNLGFMGLVLPHDDDIEDVAGDLMAALAHAGITCTPHFDDDDRARRAPLEKDYSEPGFEKTRLENTLWDRVDDIAMANQWMTLDVGGNNNYVASLLSRLPIEVRDRLESEEKAHGWAMVIVEDDRVPAGWPAMPTLILRSQTLDGIRQAVLEIEAGLRDHGTVSLPPGCDFRVQSEPVDDYTFGFLTNGTGGGAMEPDGTLTLMLTKSAPMADTHLSAPLIPEHREMVFHYGFYGGEGCWRDSGFVRAGYEFDNPLTVAVPRSHSGHLPAEGSFFAYDSDNAVVTAIKPRGNPVAWFECGHSDPSKGIVVRAYNSDGRGGSGKARFHLPALSVRDVTLMEQDRSPIAVEDGSFSWPIGPYSVETVSVELATPPPANAELPSLGEEIDAVQPIWCRYWQHNVGAHPTGYMPVGVYLDGELPVENRGGAAPTIARLRVTINNNLTDQPISGKAHVVAPSGWTVVPPEIEYSLAPREHTCVTVTLAVGKQDRTGLIKARLEFAGQVYQDVLEVGRNTEFRVAGTGMDIVKEREPQWDVFRTEHAILVRVFNPWFEPLDVQLNVVSPLETWGPVVGKYSRADIHPRVAGLTIPGRNTQTIEFGIVSESPKAPDFWAWVKLACNGMPDYKPVPPA